MNKVAEHQINPTKNNEPCIQDMVIFDIQQRKQVGIERYGTVLQPFNGRSAVLDAYQEVCDLACYMRQILAEEQEPSEALQLALDRGWFAGILDGEGCLSVNVSKKGYISMSLVVINTNLEMLEKVIKVTGCGKIYDKGRKNGKRRTYHWYLGAEEATSLLKTVLPLLTVKRKEAEAWLQLMELRKTRVGVTSDAERQLAYQIQQLKKDNDNRIHETPND